MFKFRVFVGERIATANAKIYGKKEFEATSLANARRAATNYAKTLDLKVFGTPVVWEKKWDYGNRRFTRRRCRQNCVLTIWLVSLDKDLRAF